MKKPLLLLVDDDQAVLEALEASLAPVFEEVARIETFDHSLDVIEAIPRWTEEQRSVAVAIVDQKMPGLVGAELLKRLRDDARSAQLNGRFHPATRTRAILLTGYAGLLSALFAKNEGGADRYLAKPWRTQFLVGEIRSLFATHISESSCGAFLTVGEAETKAALSALLLCRNQIARYGGTGPADVERPARPEFGPYDLRARHLAVAVVQDADPTMVGCIRVIVDREGPLAEHLRDTIASSEDIRGDLEDAATNPFPIVLEHPEGRAIDERWRRLVARGEQVVEASVPMLAASFASIETVRHAARSTVAYCSSALGPIRALVPSPPICRPIYENLGFRSVLEGVPPGHPACLLGDPAAVPLEQRPILEILESRIATTGEACMCPSYPACMPAPYVTGEFSRVDVFCPRRFREWEAEHSEP